MSQFNQSPDTPKGSESEIPAAARKVSAANLIQQITSPSSASSSTERSDRPANLESLGVPPRVFSPVFEEVCDRALTHISSVPDPMGYGAALLRYVAHQYHNRGDLGVLLKILQAETTYPSSPTSRLLSVAQFAARGIWVDEKQMRSVAAYSEVLEELLTNPRGFMRGAYRSLERQWAEYLTSPPTWNHKIHVFSALLVTEARTAGSGFIALDLLSEGSSLMEKYAARCTSKVDDETAIRVISRAVERGVAALLPIKLYVSFAKGSNSARMPLNEAEEFLSRLLSVPHFSPNLMTHAGEAYLELFRARIPPEMRAAFIEGLVVTSPPTAVKEITWLAESIQDLHRAETEPHRVRYIFGAVARGEISSFSDLRDAVSRLRGIRQLEDVSARAFGGDAAITALAASISPHHQRTSRTVPEMLQRRLQHWEDVHDIHRGFTSRLIAARRSPFREPPDLVQFATDVGGEDSVKYLNAESPNLFPGKGFLFTRLKFDRCFAPLPQRDGKPSSDPYSVYRSAWPALSPVFSDFDKTEFIFLRGLLAISCKSKEYNLLDENGSRKHYAFLVFNDHFRNPFQEVAYLVPGEGLKPLLSGAQVPANDFLGFDTRRKDVNAVIRSPRDLLRSAGIDGRAIDIGGISAILSGANQGNSHLRASAHFLSLVMETEKLQSEVVQYNRETRAWNERGHKYHSSTEGREAYRALTDKFSRMTARQRELDEQLIAADAESERTVWDLVRKYVSLHKLFCIAHAYWHRGYTAGRTVSTEHVSLDDMASPDDFSLPPPVSRQDSLQINTSSETPINRNALRMLIQAYEHHSLRRKPDSRRADFPLLVCCDAVRTGVHPATDLILDTYDMSVTLKGRKFQLSEGGMTGEDELFWLTEIFPHVKDEPGIIRDLRFYPRESFGDAFG